MIFEFCHSKLLLHVVLLNVWKVNLLLILIFVDHRSKELEDCLKLGTLPQLSFGSHCGLAQWALFLAKNLNTLITY